MRKLKKQLFRTMIACGLVVSVAVGSTVAYLTDAETATNTFTVGKVQIDLEEPGYPGNDSDEVKNIIPNQEIVKDPQIENTGSNDALAFLRVEIPQEMFTDGDDGTGAQKKQDLFRLKGVSDQWELLRTETVTREDGKAKTSYVYGYKKTLGKGATTDKLFQKVQMKNAVESDLSGNVEDIVVTACAIQATDIPDVNLTPGSDGNLSKDVLDQVYTIFLNQSGNQTSRPADEGNRSQTGKLGKITYDMGDDAVLEGALSEYGTADYGYIPPTPVREGYKFMGWTPESIPADRDGAITFTANWKADTIGTIRYDLDGGTITGEKTEYTVEDYGYVPPTPVKKGYTFTGWSLESIPDGSKGTVTFKAKWEAMTATLLDGESINAKFKKLAGDKSGAPLDTAIKAIQRSEETPTAVVTADTNSLISTDDSQNPVYAWFDNGIIKWWSEAGKVSAGTNMSSLCYYMTKLTDISGLANWDTSKVTDMSTMFSSCGKLTDLSQLSNWDTENVTDMSNMFEVCYNLTDTSPLSTWDTSNVTNMKSIFYYCGSLTNLNGLANWDTGKVTDMSGMFSNCGKLTDLSQLSNWNTGNVTFMGSMFDTCGRLTDLRGIENWDTGNVTNMYSMFGACVRLTDLTALSGWNLKNVTNAEDMFRTCRQLADLSPLTNWDTRNVTSMKHMFSDCYSLVNLGGLLNWNTGKVTSMEGMFSYCTGLTNLNALSNWDTSNVTNMVSMFRSCSSLTNLNGLANWDTTNVSSMDLMFLDCSVLTDTSSINDWNIAKAASYNIYEMFTNCPSHPEFTKQAGTWSDGTFHPTT